MTKKPFAKNILHKKLCRFKIEELRLKSQCLNFGEFIIFWDSPKGQSQH